MRRLFFIAYFLFNSTFLCFAQQPTYTPGSDVDVDQNSGAYSEIWATDIVATDPAFEILDISYSGSMNAFASGPTIDASGILSFEPVADRSGSALVRVILRDLNNNETSQPVTFRINVNFINSAPTFTVIDGDQLIDEKAGTQLLLGWATNISPGPNPSEALQELTFKATVVAQSAYMSFKVDPSVSPGGALVYEVDDTANGTATVEVVLSDDGSFTDPNENSSAPYTFTITVNPVNDQPTFNVGNNIKIDEHTGAVLIENWATNILAGPPDEQASQTVSFVLVENSISEYLEWDIPPSVDNNGTLSFTATPHYNGVSVYEIFLVDDGDDTPPNNNRSTSSAFTISVEFINDAPSFTIGPDIVMDEGDQIQIYPDWATNICPGESPNEQNQELTFSVVFQQVTGNLAFLRIPEIDDTGQLIFRATEHTHGEAIFDVYLVDDGSFEPPNMNQSEAQTFILTVEPVNYPPNDIFLSNTVVLEKQPIGTIVGFLEAADQDPEDEHTFALVMGEGSEDNDSFTINGNELLTNEEFDWATKDRYFIRIKTSDGEFSLEKTFIISVEKLIEGIKFANAITPNGDGENDSWELEDVEAYPDVTVFIYDSAGQTVFQSKQGYIPWDGTFNGQPLPMGTYYYVIDLNDGINVYKGTITIIL